MVAFSSHIGWTAKRKSRQFGNTGAVEALWIIQQECEYAEKITQTAGRTQLGDFAPMFAHLNDDVLFGEVWNQEKIDVETKCIITVVAPMASGITDSSLMHHLQNAKAHGVTKAEIAAGTTWTLTGDCTLTSLENNGTLNLNGYTITLADGTVLRQTNIRKDAGWLASHFASFGVRDSEWMDAANHAALPSCKKANTHSAA